ncbi:hypothetical protein V6259_12725 [Marinomonas sp. TI.3.20]|uniref:hypothetical protein n=1 Tax=Marinomonas sp. TI.3.20 TaxID=3121296 RepID=UPI00311D3EB1
MPKKIAMQSVDFECIREALRILQTCMSYNLNPVVVKALTSLQKVEAENGFLPNQKIINSKTIRTKVRTSKSGLHFWLQGTKLHNNGWKKGDTVSINKQGDKLVLTRISSLQRSSCTTHNIGGNARNDPSRVLLELPLKKTGVSWKLDDPVNALIENDSITLERTTPDSDIS